MIGKRGEARISRGLNTNPSDVLLSSEPYEPYPVYPQSQSCNSR
jgi:hypothetical protein